MRERKFSAALQRALARFDELGGVVEFVGLELDGRDGRTRETHREAAISTMRVIGTRLDEYYLKLLERPDYADSRRDEFFQVQMDISKMEGKRISVHEFFGSHFDCNSRRLLLRGRTPEHRNDFFWFGTEESDESMVYLPLSKSEYMTDGFAQAFTETPHGLGGSATEAHELFITIYGELFTNFAAPDHIWQWSTDWSNYFDAGYEWWGSFLWTVYIEGNAFIVGAAASTTD